MLLNNKCNRYLSVERVSSQLVDTLELMGVALGHYQSVFLPFEDFGLIHHLISTSIEVALSFN